MKAILKKIRVHSTDFVCLISQPDTIYIYPANDIF